MVALDAFEQMHAKRFQLICPDTGRYRLPGLVQIGFDLAFTQAPHGHSGNADIGKHYLAVVRNGNGRVKFMRIAGQQAQLFRGLRPTGGFAE